MKNARTEQGRYSQEQAAHAVGTTTRTLYSWEKGVASPPIDAFLRLASLYGADPAELFPKHKGAERPPIEREPGTVQLTAAQLRHQSGAKQRRANGGGGKR